MSQQPEVLVERATVDQIRFDYACTLLLSHGSLLRIESAFRVRDLASGEEETTDPNVSHDSALVVLCLLHQEVTVTLDPHPILRVDALDGPVGIDVAPNPAYEAWTLSNEDGSMIVCVPGGELARWGPHA